MTNGSIQKNEMIKHSIWRKHNEMKCSYQIFVTDVKLFKHVGC